MTKPYSQIYLHFVWATWDRAPLLRRNFRPRLFAALASKCRELDCEPIAVGGVENHIHLLAGMSPNVAPSKLVQGLKGNTSHLISHEIHPGDAFRWQAGYGVFSVSKRHLDKVKAYVLNQETHHAEGPVYDELERVSS
jgi:REP element-mobilizing transposase RayT